MLTTEESNKIVIDISKKIKTFHHHYHILYDIANLFDNCIYLEIGAYAGASACLMLNNEKVKKVISVDLGHPINQSEVLKNIKSYMGHTNYNYTYVQGSSSSKKVLDDVKEILKNETIDILFIDGDHTYNGVKNDFETYSVLVSKGGYIIFDDYHCKQSPEVKKYIDYLIESDFILNNYDVIGCISNEIGAKPKTLKTSNEFILKKK